ncbi:hypothetical protein ACIQSP_19875 [Streptomyces nigra]|uniref:hypothetical protein n=1 Tax=Streptomyces nigra TaxID=1827580 RepID=UPI0037F8126D
MHDLTPIQRTTVDFARRDLAQARAADLAVIDAAHLILLVEQLRGRLHQVLEVVDEVTATPPP